MRKLIGIFSLLICLNMITSAQSRKLLLLDNEKFDTIQILENRKVDIQLIDDYSIRGKFTILNDSCIIIKDSIIQLNRISKIGYIKERKRIIGNTLIIIGGMVVASVLIYNVYNKSQPNEDSDLRRLIVNIGSLSVITPTLGIGLSQRFIYSYFNLDTKITANNRAIIINPVYKLLIMN